MTTGPATLSRRPSAVVVSDDIRTAIGRAFGERPVRLAYIPGPGNVFGTHAFWVKGEDDPNLPVVAYSAMFYDLCEALGANALILQRVERGSGRTSVAAGRFTFEFVEASKPGAGALAYWKAATKFSLDCIGRVSAFAPDVVIVGGGFFWPLMPLLKKKPGSKLILSMHNVFWTGDRRPLRAQIRDTLKRAVIRHSIDGAVAVSEECRRQFIRLGAGKTPALVCRIQCKASDLDRIFAQDQAGTEKARGGILFIGRVEESKGAFDLLEAFLTLAKQNPDLTVTYVGDGGALEELKRRAERSAAATRITIAGRLNGAGVHARLENAALLVCPTRKSFAEGLPAVCVEALAHGVPVVASSVVPCHDLLGEACAIFPAEDVGALAGLVGALLADRARLDQMRAIALEKRRGLADPSLSWGSALAQLVGALCTDADLGGPSRGLMGR